jgi:ligand-binding SRPBCC domain-containing protein
MTRVIAEQWVARPLKSVFRFFSDPNNLPQLMPSAQDVHIVALRLVEAPCGQREGIVAADVGSEIVISLRPVPLLPLRVQWTARIVEYAQDEAFADEQVSGRFRRWAASAQVSRAATGRAGGYGGAGCPQVRPRLGMVGPGCEPVDRPPGQGNVPSPPTRPGIPTHKKSEQVLIGDVHLRRWF